MFSTFTGSSRRPRNVNLSGQTSNPFSNTTWSPSAASNATKTVSDAQADREKRQVERRRLKAASQIQKTWRGYRSRSTLKEQRRNDFDLVYKSLSDADAIQRLYRTKLLVPHNVTHKLTRLLSDTSLGLQHILTLINHLGASFPLIILASVNEYYAALAKLCQSQRSQEWQEAVFRSISAPLNTGAENGMQNWFIGSNL
ncbi:hypothetical protein ACHAPE_000466 [Trichoderma viride]